jgi:hypothetical protein
MTLNISRKQFEDAYRKFPPGKFELYFLKYHSVYSLKALISTELILSIMLLLPFLFALLGHFFNWSKSFTYVPSFIYAGILAVLGIYMLLIWYKKAVRIRKLRKYLNISKKQYQNLLNIYFYNRYSTLEEYLEYNSE